MADTMRRYYETMEKAFSVLGRGRLMSQKSFHYFCGPVCGAICGIIFLFSLVAARQLPPVRADLTPEQTVAFFQEHKQGTKIGSALMMISATFYLPYTASISAQMRRVPNLHYLVSALQLASGAAGLFTFITPAQILGLIPYRLERDPEITQMLTDLFFFFLLMPWQSFIVQNWAFAYAILIDQRPNPIFPKFMAVFNIIAPILFVPTTALHFDKTGGTAYHGAVFYLVGVTFVFQLFLDSACLYIAISRDDSSGSDTAPFPFERGVVTEKETPDHVSNSPTSDSNV